MELRLGSSGKKDAEDEPTKGNLAGGCCFDFNKVSALSNTEDANVMPISGQRLNGSIRVVLLPTCYALYCNGPMHASSLYQSFATHCCL